jgi:hypothetical protein
MSAPLSDLEKNKYASNRMSYPKDIQNLAHCIAFYINVHEYSKDANKAIEGAVTKSNQVRQDRGIVAAPVNRSTKRIADNIRLYMPEIMQFDYNQTYEQPSLAEATTSLVGSFVDDALKKFSKNRSGGMINSLKEKSQSAATLVRAATGVALNPIIEVLYSRPQLRKFQFDFTFAPSSKEETESVKKIIKEFRRHQAPEYAVGGLFFLSPSEFDIEFLMNVGNGFTINKNIPRISSCVLETLNVNYVPQGQFTTFYDGMPVSIQLRLSFMEVDIVTRESIDKFGF